MLERLAGRAHKISNNDILAFYVVSDVMMTLLYFCFMVCSLLSKQMPFLGVMLCWLECASSACFTTLLFFFSSPLWMDSFLIPPFFSSSQWVRDTFNGKLKQLGVDSRIAQPILPSNTSIPKVFLFFFRRTTPIT